MYLFTFLNGMDFMRRSSFQLKLCDGQHGMSNRDRRERGWRALAIGLLLTHSPHTHLPVPSSEDSDIPNLNIHCGTRKRRGPSGDESYRHEHNSDLRHMYSGLYVPAMLLVPDTHYKIGPLVHPAPRTLTV